MAVVRMSGPLELYRIDRTRRASLLRTLRGPTAGAQALDVAMTAGAAPKICATWLTQGEAGDRLARSALLCYAPAATKGTTVATGDAQPSQIALTPDGRRLAWSELSRGMNERVLAGVLDQGTVSEVRSFRARRGEPADQFNGHGVGDLAWVGTGKVAISEVVESDDGPALRLFDVSSPGDRGWLDAVRVEPSKADFTAGYWTYDGVASVEGMTAIAVERTSYQAEPRVPHRAVRIALPSGRILEVLATAGADRDMLEVSGSDRAVVYTTASRTESTTFRTSVRFAGEAKGAPVVGLPEDVQSTLAQP